MTQDEIIELAREAWKNDILIDVLLEHNKFEAFEYFAKLVADSVYENEDMFAEAYAGGYAAGAVAEREACAKLCEESNDIGSSYGLAQAIRTRGQK